MAYSLSHWLCVLVTGLCITIAAIHGASGEHCDKPDREEGIWTERDGAIFKHNVDLPSRKPLIVAHRGSSGMLPEHTVEAYQLAIDQGADVIECDLTVTRDLRLVCLHDSWLSTTTDSPDVFPPDRIRTYFIPDHDDPQNITDHFTPDFTLAELKTLRKKERFPHRNMHNDGRYVIPTLEEFIEVVKKSSVNGKIIGIAPEIKNPVFLNRHPTLAQANILIHELLLPVLEKYGYTSKTDPCFVQSFDFETLERCHMTTSLPLVYLFRKGKHEISLEDLEHCSKLCYAIGPHKTHIYNVDENNYILKQTNLVKGAHGLGLRVWPYTFRNDDVFLPWDYGKDGAFELLDFMHLGVDGYFTDFPRTAKRVIEGNHIMPGSVCDGNL